MLQCFCFVCCSAAAAAAAAVLLGTKLQEEALEFLRCGATVSLSNDGQAKAEC
jgi:hypothetical protein